MHFVRTISRSRAGVLHGLGRLRSVPPFIARYVLGITFVSTGWAKLHDLGSVTNYFAELRLPAPGFMAGLVGATEFLCGALLLLGLVTRLSAIPLLVTMVVALATAKRGEISGLPALFGMIETAYTVLLLYLVVSGPGALSVDKFLAYRLEKETGTEQRPHHPPRIGVAQPA